MGLNEKQALFTGLLGKLLVWCFDNHLDVILAEAFRTPEHAKIYAETGRGIRNSNHTKKLAADLFRYKEGTISWDREDYEVIGCHWKSLHKLCRWGGDFKGRDSVHFSLEHNGVK